MKLTTAPNRPREQAREKSSENNRGRQRKQRKTGKAERPGWKGKGKGKARGGGVLRQQSLFQSVWPRHVSPRRSLFAAQFLGAG